MKVEIKTSREVQQKSAELMGMGQKTAFHQRGRDGAIGLEQLPDIQRSIDSGYTMFIQGGNDELAEALEQIDSDLTAYISISD